MTLAALTLALALAVQQPAPPVQRPPEITISVEEYTRLKICEAKAIEQAKKHEKQKPVVVAIVGGIIIAIVAIAKGKK